MRIGVGDKYILPLCIHFETLPVPNRNTLVATLTHNYLPFSSHVDEH